MRLTSKCQVTIPQGIREQAGLAPGCEVEFHFSNGRIWIEKIETGEPTRRLQIMDMLNEVVGSATANQDLRTNDLLRMTRGED